MSQCCHCQHSLFHPISTGCMHAVVDRLRGEPRQTALSQSLFRRQSVQGKETSRDHDRDQRLWHICSTRQTGRTVPAPHQVGPGWSSRRSPKHCQSPKQLSCPTPAGLSCTLQGQQCQAPQSSRHIHVPAWLTSDTLIDPLYLLLVNPVLPGCDACLQLLSMLLGGSILLSSLRRSLQTSRTNAGGQRLPSELRLVVGCLASCSATTDSTGAGEAA